MWGFAGGAAVDLAYAKDRPWNYMRRFSTMLSAVTSRRGGEVRFKEKWEVGIQTRIIVRGAVDWARDKRTQRCGESCIWVVTMQVLALRSCDDRSKSHDVTVGRTLRFGASTDLWPGTREYVDLHMVGNPA